MPKIAYVIGALAVLWFILRLYMRRNEERRTAEREERLAKLYQEREEILARRAASTARATDLPPSSLGAVTSDSQPGKAAVEPAEGAKVVVRCRACRTLNDEGATRCSACGEAL